MGGGGHRILQDGEGSPGMFRVKENHVKSDSFSPEKWKIRFLRASHPTSSLQVCGRWESTKLEKSGWNCYLHTELLLNPKGWVKPEVVLCFGSWRLKVTLNDYCWRLIPKRSMPNEGTHVTVHAGAPSSWLRKHLSCMLSRCGIIETNIDNIKDLSYSNCF